MVVTDLIEGEAKVIIDPVKGVRGGVVWWSPIRAKPKEGSCSHRLESNQRRSLLAVADLTKGEPKGLSGHQPS